MPGLRNVFRLTPKLFCGSEPHGDEGFASLGKLGILTVISVDGATPDLLSARAVGIRYVHLPIGYDGVPVDRGFNLAFAVDRLDGPIYIHCHKGVHRGPAATAYALVALHQMDPETAVAFLHEAGTAEIYSGLFASVRRAALAESAPPADFTPDLPARARRSSLTMSMVEVDHTWERIESCRAADWVTPSDHPDLDCAAECVILMEHFREARRLPDTAKRSADFDGMLLEAEEAALALSEAVRAGAPTREAAFQAVQSNCTSCHAIYRN